MVISDFRIYIDPGHGGIQPGAVTSDGTKEKDINLSVATKLNAILNGWGVTTKMSRVGDTNVDYTAVATDANNWGTDIFVSIHCNSGGAGGSGGTETYTHTTYSNYSNDLATKINSRVVTALGTVNRGIKRSNYAVLSGNNSWCCLTELAFMDVPADLTKLKDPTYQQKAAQAIANGIDSFVFDNFRNIGTM